MALPELQYTKSWLSPGDFPTDEPSEEQVRADMQLLHDEVKTFLNGALIPAVESHGHDDIYLRKGSVVEFIPTMNYDPATKKYVDDFFPRPIFRGPGDFTAAVNNSYRISFTGDYYAYLPNNAKIGDKIVFRTMLTPGNIFRIYLTGGSVRGCYPNFTYTQGHFQLKEQSFITLVSLGENMWIMTDFYGTVFTTVDTVLYEQHGQENPGYGFTTLEVPPASGNLPYEIEKIPNFMGETIVIADLSTRLAITLTADRFYPGARIKIVGRGIGGWELRMGDGVSIFCDPTSPTPVTGKMYSSNRYASMELLCVFSDGANSEFVVTYKTASINIT